ncbi:MAG TPA: SCO family protein [Verrucomicrobiae bacterium]|nr:SCO family protein [Verrucomicrobiae bacterium]
MKGHPKAAEDCRSPKRWRAPAGGLFSILLLAALLVTACDKNQPASLAQPGALQTTNRQTFEARGVVLAVKPLDKQVEIKHEAIPGYMQAMTMPFDVKDTNLLAELEPGERISFRLVVTKSEGWIDQIRKLAPPNANALPPAASIRRARDVEPLGIGDVLPECHFTNQFGQSFSTRQFDGQALAITFLFTRCPFPNFCPRMATDFSEVQQKLLALQNGPTNWHLLTISFDPAYDTPQVLRRYAQAFKFDPARWTFATGGLMDITAITEQFGMAFWHDETGSISHNLRTAVIDSKGRVQKILNGNTWTADELVDEMIKASGK